MIKDAMNKNENVSVNGREIEALKEYFPACFHDGEFDLERFKEYLADQLVVRNDGYELKFLGKNYGRLLASMDTTTIVVPDEEHNSKPENADSQNIYISGDNLDGLKHLLKSYAHSVQCIYIDPPYNTGSDGFVYNDSFDFTAEELTEKLSIDETQAQRILDLVKRGSASHSAWLMFMYPRLLLARDLLSDDGVIFISIDDNEQANLKLLCDDVFGEENFVNCITVKAKNSAGASGGGEDKKLKKNCEFVLWYARKKEQFDFDAPTRETDLMDYIAQHKKDDIGFYYTRILLDEGDKREVAKLNEDDDGEIKIYEHYNYKLDNVGNIAKKEGIAQGDVYLKYFDKIFMVTNAQTSILSAVNKTIGEKQKLISYEYTPKSGKDRDKRTIKYIWNETLVVWLHDSAYINMERNAGCMAA